MGKFTFSTDGLHMQWSLFFLGEVQGWEGLLNSLRDNNAPSPGIGDNY